MTRFDTGRWMTARMALGALCAALGALSSPFAATLSWPEMLAQVRSEFPEVRQLSTADLAARLGDESLPGLQLLDAREQGEFDVSHLAGAVRVPPDASAQDILEHLDPARPVVVYCSVGYRSSRIAARLMKAGLREVSNLEGSLFAWANEGRPLVTGEGKATALVHPFDAHYGQLLKPEHRAP